MAETEQMLRRLLGTEPDNLQALRLLASLALRRGAAGQAIDLLNRAADIDRSHVGTLIELGVAYRAADRMDAARYVLERALELGKGQNTRARLLLANVLELDQRPEPALLQYFRAILDAQQGGRWLDDDTTEPGLRSLVRHAAAYVMEARHALFDEVFKPWREHLDDVATGRIAQALAVYLREVEPPAGTPRRGGLHIHDLGRSPRVDRETPAWLPALLSRASAAASGVEAFMAPAAASDHTRVPVPVGSSDANAATTAGRRIDIYRRGIVPDSVRHRAPPWLSAIADAPLLRIPGYGPNASLIALPGGTRMQQPQGCSNCCCATLVGLPGSASLDVEADGELFKLREGEAMVFDASRPVEYVNRSAAEARLLVFDVWHPDLGPAEQQALGALIAAMVDFDTQLQELT